MCIIPLILACPFFYIGGNEMRKIKATQRLKESWNDSDLRFRSSNIIKQSMFNDYTMQSYAYPMIDELLSLAHTYKSTSKN